MVKKGKIFGFFIIFILFMQLFFQNNIAISSAKNVEELTLAKSMIAVEQQSGRVLYSKNENEKLPMASTTKIITAIVAIENSDDLDKKHTIPNEAVGVEGSSIYLKKNEQFSLRELLYGLMLRSGNDASVAIAVIVGGSVSNFVDMMNNFCQKLGMTNTHIVTVNGLHDDNHYTTASDLALVSCYAMKNPLFEKIVSTTVKRISDLDGQRKDIVFVNKNKLLKLAVGGDGIKTGYTKKAGKCFVGSAKRGNMRVICVVLGAPNMFDDCKKIIDKAFLEFSNVLIMKKGKVSEIELESGKKKIVEPVYLTEDIYYPLKKGEMADVSASVKLDEKVTLPHSYEVPVGKIEIRLKNDLIFSEKLFTINVEKIGERSHLKKIISVF